MCEYYEWDEKNKKKMHDLHVLNIFAGNSVLSASSALSIKYGYFTPGCSMFSRDVVCMR